MNVKFLLLMLCLVLLGIVAVKAQEASGTSFYVLVDNTGRLGFQNNIWNYVRLEVTSGVLNSSQNSVGLNLGGGHFIFTALNDTTLRLTHNVTNIKAGGDSGNPFRQIYNGDSLTVLTGNAVTINWDLPGVEPWLPVMFILGMTGLVSLFGGSLYAVDRIKKKLYQEGLINGVIFVSIGFALFISWLWAA